MTDFWAMPAREIVRGVSRRDFTCRDVLDSTLARIDEINPSINAIVDIHREQALAAATEMDDVIAGGSEIPPMAGVPVTIKINTDVRGRPTTNGVVAFRDNIASGDAACVENLRKAGAIIVGQTNVPAFSTRGFTDNDLHGRTLNPWNPELSPGGSSGGAAAAVSTGMGTIAHGTDRAGSVRYPAFCCGVYGLRPTLGRIPHANSTGGGKARGISSQLFTRDGVLGRTVDDIRLGLAGMEGYDPRDPWSVPPRPPAGGQTDRPIRVGVVRQLPGVSFGASVEAALESAVELLASGGAQVEEVSLPDYYEAFDLFWPLLFAEELQSTGDATFSATDAINRFGDQKTINARASAHRVAKKLSHDQYVAGLTRRAEIIASWQVLLKDYDVLMTHASGDLPFPVDYDQQGDEAVRNTQIHRAPMLAASLVGLPSLAAPCGMWNGQPTGVQLIGQAWGEEAIFSAAELLEAGSGLSWPTGVA